MDRARASLGVEVAAVLATLRAGRGITPDGRRRLEDVLARVIVALSGRPPPPPPPRAADDPAALVEAAVELARAAGMDGVDLQRAFDVAAERPFRRG